MDNHPTKIALRDIRGKFAETCVCLIHNGVVERMGADDSCVNRSRKKLFLTRSIGVALDCSDRMGAPNIYDMFVISIDHL